MNVVPKQQIFYFYRKPDIYFYKQNECLLIDYFFTFYSNEKTQ